MLNKSTFFHIGEGVLRGFFLTLILIFFYAILATFIDVGGGARSACIVVFTCISIIYASVYATKKIGKKGFATGIIVAAVYILIIYIVAIIAGRSPIIAVNDLYRICLALVVGCMSGMLGINL